MKPKGILILVLDDAGYNMAQAKRFMDLPIKLTVAVLPGLAHTQSVAAYAQKKKRQILLHQPMETIKGDMKDPGVIRSSMSPQEQLGMLRHNLDQLPGALGLNNHEGSRGTQDLALMRLVMTELKGRGLFFLDSRTTSQTVAPQAAKEIGLTFSQRDVFLDNIADENEIRKSLEKGMELAEKRGYAVMIGHVWSDELYDVVLQDYLEIQTRGFNFEMLGDFLLTRNPVQPGLKKKDLAP